MKIAVVGSFMMDLVVRTPRLPSDGETIIGTNFQRFPGGKGANQAVAAARLGAQVTMIGKLGNDSFGSEMLTTLQAETINTEHVLIGDSIPTGVGSVTVDELGNNRIVVVPGANLHYTTEDLNDAEAIIADSNLLMLQLEMDLRVVEKAAHMAIKHNVPVLLNPAPAQDLRETLLEKIDYLTPNETEARLLTGVQVNDTKSAAKAARILRNKGVKNVIITLGSLGALSCSASGTQYISGFEITPVDTVGAGDAFNGAFALSVLEGKTIQESVLFANAAGALSVTKHGAIPSLPNRSDIDRLIVEQLKHKDFFVG